MGVKALYFVVGCGVLLAQPNLPPVIQPRGVVNATTLQPAPSSVAPGGLIAITGLNLGPAMTAVAPDSPWPTELGGLRVLVNNRPAPIKEAGLSRVVAQIPYEVQPGLVNVVIERGEQRSQPVRVQVVQSQPGLRSENGTGYGAAWGAVEIGMMRLEATGFGIPDPRLPNGEAGEAVPRGAVRAYVGGLPAEVQVSHSTGTPGVYDVQLRLPEGTRPGDSITLIHANAGANAVTVGRAQEIETQMQRFGDLGFEVRGFASPELRGSFLAVYGARTAEGCYPAAILDTAKGTVWKVESCLTSAQPNAANPFIVANEGAALAALVGPPRGQAPSGVTDKVLLFSPLRDTPMEITLPDLAATVNPAAGGEFLAVLAGTPLRAVMIDPDTGEVREATVNPGAGGGQQLPGGALALRIDLGDGLNVPLTPATQIAQGVRAVLIGDNLTNPTRAKLALLNPQNEVTGTRDFPEGVVPLAAPPPTVQNPAPGQPLPPAAQVRLPVPAVFDAQARALFVLARRPDHSRHGLVAFPVDEQPARILAAPEGWFVTACTGQIPVFSVQLTRKLAFLGSLAAEKEFKQQCPANGYLTFDLATQRFAAVPLPGQGEFNATAGTNDVNDFLTGVNTDPVRRNIADTLYVLDGVSSTAYRMDLPAGISGFANLQPVPALSSMVGIAVNRVAGDAGIVVFDLESVTPKVFPTPEGFATVNLLGLFTTQRKLIARGILAQNAGSQLLVYDLDTGDLDIVPNPEGVAFLGTPPAQAQQPPGGGGGGGGGQQQPQTNLPPRASVRSGVVTAITYGEDRQPNGAVAFRIP
ncbi:MAG: IPT/TIG domain-containing protein [Bryobacter sp.]|nr:IPT/TIG domain-containing protein [Bryobacter sp.]